MRPAVGTLPAALLTDTGMTEEVVALRAASLAMAVRLWVPLVAEVVFQEME